MRLLVVVVINVAYIRFNVHIKHHNEEQCDLNDFDHSMTVSARWAGLSVSETANLLGGFMHSILEKKPQKKNIQ